MQEKTSSDRPTPAGTSATTATTYRDLAGRFLAASQELTKDFPAAHKITEKMRRQLSLVWKDDPTSTFEASTGLLVRKAHLHVAAALRANQSNNMHSLAAQMRPALECAGQVVTTMKNLRDGSSKARESVMRRAKADFFQTATRVGRGQLDPRKILEENPNIQLASHHMDPVKGRINLQDAVKDLKFGEWWYQHLSRSFYHSGVCELKGDSFYGGVRSTNWAGDQIAFALFMHYLIDQVLLMILYAAMCPPVSKEKEQCYKKAGALAKEKRKVLDSFQNSLVSKGQMMEAARSGC